MRQAGPTGRGGDRLTGPYGPIGTGKSATAPAQHACMPTDEALRARIIANPGTWLVTGALGNRPQWRLREGLTQAIEWYAAGAPVQRSPASHVA